jgi:hypothetical protein
MRSTDVTLDDILIIDNTPPYPPKHQYGLIMMRVDCAAGVMPNQCPSMSVVPHDLVLVIKCVGHEIQHGLDISNTPAVEALARQLESNLIPRIIPDRRYTLRELEERFGFTHSAFYRNHKQLIRKDGRKSFVLGRDLLAYLDACPRLMPVVDDRAGTTVPRRRRGRPSKTPSDDPDGTAT